MPRKPARTQLKEHYFVDASTGEEKTYLEEHQVDGRTKRKQHKAGFTMFWLDELMKLPPLPWSALRTLAALTKFHNRETGTILYRVPAICKETGEPHESAVSRNIIQLIEAGVLYRIARSEVMLNPELLWIGDPLSKEKAMERVRIIKEGGTV